MARSVKDSYSKTRKRKISDSIQQNNVLRVGIYRRVSTKEQADEGQSLQAQKGKIGTYLKYDSSFENKDQHVIDYVDEGASAKDLKRDQLQRLLHDIENDLLDYVVVVKLDRLTRNLEDLQTLINKFESKKVKLVSINEKLDTQTATGRFFISILGSIAQLEREQISERVHDTFEQLIFDKPLGGATPFGYLYSYVSEGEYIAYTKENAQLYNLPPIKVYDKTSDEIYPGTYVTYIFDWFASYSSISKVAKRLNDLAIPIPRIIQQHVKEYQNKKNSGEHVPKYILILKPGFWSRTTVRDILLNPFYTGVRVWNRFENRTKLERDSIDWIFVDNAHEKIIDEKTYVSVTSLYEEIKKKSI
jgi:DNA invertase Pin-like site-specific DNA recombinase